MSVGAAVRRIAVVLGWTLLVLVVLTAIGLFYLLGTSAGARTAISFGLARSPVPVTIEGTDGPLSGPLILTGVQVEYEGLHASVGRLALDWRPLQLLRRRVVVDSLRVTGIDVVVPEGWSPPPGEEEEEAPPPEGPPTVPDLPVDVWIEDLRIEIDRLRVGDRAEVHASVLSGRGSPDSLRVALEVNGEAAPVETFRVLATVEGAPERYRLAGDLSFTSAGMPPVEAELESNGSLTELAVDRAVLRTANGRAELEAVARWHPEVAWEVAADADGLEVAPFTPAPEEWPGQVSFRARSQGRLGEAGPEAVVTLDELSGEVRDQPLSGRVAVRVGGQRLDVDSLGLRWGEATIRVAGSVAESIDLTFALATPDLARAWPGASGAVRVEGSAAGSRTEPRVDARFEISGLAVANAAVARAEGVVDLDLAPGAANAVVLRADSVVSGGLAIDSVTVGAEGTRESHRVGVQAGIGEDRAAVRVSGGLVEDGGGGAPVGWRGSVDTLSIDLQRIGAWRLQRSARVHASADSAGLEPLCLVQDEASLCAEGRWASTGATQGELRITALPLALLVPPGQEDLQVDGALDGSGRVDLAPGGRLAADGAFQAAGTIAARVGEDTTRFRLEGDGVRFGVDAQGARADLALSLVTEDGGGAFEVTGALSLPGYTSTAIALDQQPIEGRLEIGSDDLAFVSSFAPPVRDAGGRLRLESVVSGTAAEPAIQGSLAVEDGQADLPALGLELRDAQLTARGEPGAGIELTGHVRSGDGEMNLEGRVPLQPTAGEPAEIRLSGERFRAVSTPEIQVEIETDLEIVHDGSLTTVGGRVGVPWARVELVEVPPSAVSPSQDVVFVGEEPTPTPDVDATIDIEIGDDVTFQGFGFSAGIEGSLRVRQEPGNTPIVLGDLEFIDGRYVAYGQDLDIEPGRVIFSGPPEDATLDVTALREAEDGTLAGFVITGPMTEPRIQLTSDPSMSDADVLSYVLYGQALSDGDPSQQGRVAGAAATLGANVLTTKLASSVGLDEARVEGGTREDMELVAGKYLTPNVYVSYGMGLFKPSNTFRIRYLLNSSWAIEAESGEANGADVLYQIERGQ